MKLLSIKNCFVTGTLIAVTLISQTATANTNSGLIDRIQNQQKHKIYQGIRSGELTGKETWRLAKQQKHIYMKERRFKSDGHFTRRERAKVHADLAKASISIYKQKHDRQMQGSFNHGVRSPGINKRERYQAKRIVHGVRSGQLTARETAKLSKQQVRIHRQERRFKSDGNFTKRERARVYKHQNRASRKIYRAKHN